MDNTRRIGQTLTANLVKRDGLYHILMLVDGQWLDTGIIANDFMEATAIADQQFDTVYLNAPIAPPQECQKRAAA